MEGFIDPWGKPYKLVLRKIKPKTLSSTITRPRENIEEMLTKLFPPDNRREATTRTLSILKAEESLPDVREEEIERAVKRMSAHQNPMEYPGK